MAERRRIDRLSILVGQKVSHLYILAVAITAYEVLMRYAFRAPTTWVHDATVALSAIAFVLAGPYVQQAGSHIRISSLYERVGAGPRRWIDAVNLAIALLYLVLLGYGATVRAAQSVPILETTGTASDLPTPAILKSVLALGIVLMAVQVLVQLGARLRGEE